MSPRFSLAYHRRCLRRTAWVTLVGWLWALAAGVVNACALAPSGALGHDAALVPFAAADGLNHAGAKNAAKPGNHDGEVWHVGNAGGEHDADKASCLKFCEEGSSALAKGTASPLDPGTLATALAPTWRPDVTAPRAATWQPQPTPFSQGLPLAIRFQRLTL